MTKLYKRNVQFKKDLPKYRFALKKWAWRGSKKITLVVYHRLLITQAAEIHISSWKQRENFITRFFIEPPDQWIKEVLSWP